MEILCNLLMSIPSESKNRMGKSGLFSLSNSNRWETEYLLNIFISYPLFIWTHRPWPGGKWDHLCMNGQNGRTALLQVLRNTNSPPGWVFLLSNVLSVILKKRLRWLGKENNRRVIRLFTESVCLNVKEHFCSSSIFPSIGFTFSNSTCFQDWGYLKQSTVPMAEK